MSLDRRIGSKVDKTFRREDALGTRVDPYPYIGIVKNNLDPTRSGRLQVFIPDLGGDPDDKKAWRTVRYASPFLGYTPGVEKSPTNSFTTVQHHYGMWMVPPDLGVQVICLFIAGDPQRGYWLACVNPYLSHHMVPGLAGSENVDTNTAGPEAKKGVVAGNRMPVAEFNLTQKELLSSTFYNNLKPIHETQFNILKNQGLDKDTVRGSITSSSQRETPSHVFGISTPGRPLNDPADNAEQYQSQANDAKIARTDLQVRSRKGGHTFVMDDGAVLGQDQLVRIRSAKGHQILLHDTADSLYISHANGNSWIELTSTGSLMVYTKGSYSIHSEGTMNFRCGGNMNFDVGGSIRWRAAGKAVLNSASYDILCDGFKLDSAKSIELKTSGPLTVDSGGKISLQSGDQICLQGSKINQNSGGTKTVKKLEPLKTTNFANSELDAGTGTWQIKPGKISSIVTVLPTHEPYGRSETVATFEVESNGIQPQASYTGEIDATKNTAGTEIRNAANEEDIRNQPETNQTVGPLNKEQMQAYYAQIGKSESGGDYSKVNSIGFVGKYQFGYQALIDMGYVKSNVTSNSQLDNPNSWTGKDGIESKDTWLDNGTIQEKAMEGLTQRNYNTLLKNGTITKDTPPEDVGGILATSHLLGPTGAKRWRSGAGGQDAYGTTGDSYFQKGKFAIAALGPKVGGVNAG